MGIDFQTGEIIHITAKTIIMATGGGGKLYPVNSNTPDATGNVAVLAVDAGADLVDMEFILMLGHAVLHPQTVRGVLFTFQCLSPKGARAPFNGLNEPFLANYDPEGSDNPPRHIYARAIYGEVRAGRGSPHGDVYFDPGSVPPETLMETLPSQTQYIESPGVDMSRPIAVGVAAHYDCGGIKIGPHAQSNIPGLYAVGECSGGPHGAARVGGNFLIEVLVYGKRAGRHATETAAESTFPVADRDEIDAECDRLLGFFDPSRHGKRPTKLIHRLKSIMGEHVGVVRNDAGLTQALADIEQIAAHDLPTMSLASGGRVANYDWILALEISSMTILAEIVTRACLERTESRGAHYRDDFAETNDEEWLQNIIIRRRDDAISIGLTPVGAARKLEKAGEKMVKFKLRIQRFDPKQDDTPHHENFDLGTEGDLNVIQAIRHIHETIDGSLAFRNTDCRRGVCGLCSMIIVGKRRLACMCVAADGMTIEPPPNV